MPINL